MDCSMPGFPVHHQLLELAQTHIIEAVMTSKHLILCCCLVFLPSIFSSIRIFSNESVLRIRWPKYWSFSFSINPSNEYSGLISFRMDWLDLLAVLGTLRSLLQQHSSKASILRCSAFFIFQLSHPHTTTRKTIALARWNLSFRAWLTVTVSNYAWSHQEMVTVVYFIWAFRDEQEFAKRKVHQASWLMEPPLQKCQGLEGSGVWAELVFFFPTKIRS